MSNLYKGIAYTTVVDKGYLPLLDKLIETHQKFSEIDLYIYTVNYKVTDRKYNNIHFIECEDVNLLEYEQGKSTIIKNSYEKHKYGTTLKPKFLSHFIQGIKYYFFIDCDVLFTKNSDALFLNSIKEFGDTETPISTRFFHQFCNHGNSENVFNEDGSINVKSLTYKPLCDLYGTDPKINQYVSTYCMYYTNKCGGFFEEVDKICLHVFEENLNCDLYLPLGDETVFNYFYSNNNFTKSLSSFSCYNLSPLTDIKLAINNVKKLHNIISFIHTKRMMEGFVVNNIELNDIEYNYIVDILSSKDHFLSPSKILPCTKDYYRGLDVIEFRPGDNYPDSEVKVVSLENQTENYYKMNLKKGVNYFVSKSVGLINKQIYLIIYREDEIKDVLGIVY